jgi:hypothetical protein
VSSICAIRLLECLPMTVVLIDKNGSFGSFGSFESFGPFGSFESFMMCANGDAGVL